MDDTSTYATPVRALFANADATAAKLDGTLRHLHPTWTSWEVPTVLLELDRGGAPVHPANQARIRGLLALHLTGECFVSPDAFEALAWLFGGVEAPGLRASPVDLLHALDQIRTIAVSHEEIPPPYAHEVTQRIADVCRREGYICLPAAYPDVQTAIHVELDDSGLAIEKKARQLVQRARSASSPNDYAFEETPEGVAAARCLALEYALTR